MKYFMVDIETMGTDMDADDIIQIAFLELDKKYDGTYKPGRSYKRTLHTSQKPRNDWIANTHKDLLPVCNRLPMVQPYKVRNEILGFFQSCGVKGPAMLMGLNATTFDIPYLVRKGILVSPKQDSNNQLIGDYHYRIYELKGAYNLARDVMGLDDKKLFQMAADACPDYEMPDGHAHDALYDCHSQTRTLNGVIRLMRQSQAV